MGRGGGLTQVRLEVEAEARGLQSHLKAGWGWGPSSHLSHLMHVAAGRQPQVPIAWLFPQRKDSREKPRCLP